MPLRELARPSYSKLMLAALLSFLSVAGAIQSYAFIDDVPGYEAPPLYEALRPLSLWFAWVIFTAPLHLSVSLLCSSSGLCGLILPLLPSLGAVRLPLASIAYSVLAAWWVVYSWDRWLRGSGIAARLAVLLAPLIAALLLSPPLWFISHVGPLFLLSGLAALYAVLAVYAVGIYGLYREARVRLRLR